MPYVKRDETGRIIAASTDGVDNAWEEVATEAPELLAFVNGLGSNNSALEVSDFKLIRAIEDVIDVLIQKNVICITDLPPAVQNKLMDRRSLRHSMNALKLFGDDEQGTI